MIIKNKIATIILLCLLLLSVVVTFVYIYDSRIKEYYVDMVSYKEYEEKYGTIYSEYTIFLDLYQYLGENVSYNKTDNMIYATGSEEGKIDGVGRKNKHNEKIVFLEYFLKGGFQYKMYPRGDIQLEIEYQKKNENYLYVGFYDGSCYYPKEFELEEDPKVCERYLDDVLVDLNYDSVEEMLIEEFDGLIKKGKK